LMSMGVSLPGAHIRSSIHLEEGTAPRNFGEKPGGGSKKKKKGEKKKFPAR